MLIVIHIALLTISASSPSDAAPVKITEVYQSTKPSAAQRNQRHSMVEGLVMKTVNKLRVLGTGKSISVTKTPLVDTDDTRVENHETLTSSNSSPTKRDTSTKYDDKSEVGKMRLGSFGFNCSALKDEYERRWCCQMTKNHGAEKAWKDLVDKGICKKKGK